MKITLDNFEGFINGNWDWDEKTATNTGLVIYPKDPKNRDIGGGKLTKEDIDELKNHPQTDTLSIMGLHQDTFEYFIKTYGKQLKAIRFFKNKMVSDWSLLGSLPDLEFVYFFHNQRIESFWDMSQNHALQGVAINDFSRLKSLKGIEKAKNLKHFHIGDAVWAGAEIDSFRYFENSDLEVLTFGGKSVADLDMEFLYKLPKIREFSCPANILTTEQIAWIRANFPQLQGDAQQPFWEYRVKYPDRGYVTYVKINGKRKPSFEKVGNEAKLQKYIDKFNDLVKKYKGVAYNQVGK